MVGTVNTVDLEYMVDIDKKNSYTQFNSWKKVPLLVDLAVIRIFNKPWENNVVISIIQNFVSL